MLTRVKHGLAAVLFAASLTPAIQAVADGDGAAIADLLQRYETALNAGDVGGVMRLYAVDGVFMPQNNPSAVGAEAVRQAYAAVFGAIDLDIDFEIAEIVSISDTWAFARTNSAGTVTVLANGAASPAANQELFVLTKGADGAWKIARYAFSTTEPARP